MYQKNLATLVYIHIYIVVSSPPATEEAEEVFLENVTNAQVRFH
jgi:hypothetical protein